MCLEGRWVRLLYDACPEQWGSGPCWKGVLLPVVVVEASQSLKLKRQRCWWKYYELRCELAAALPRAMKQRCGAV